MINKQKIVMAVMIIVAVAMLLGCTVTTAYPTTFHVTGDFGNVAGATVTIAGYTPATTDVNGIAVINLPAGVTPYDYTVSATGYVTKANTVTVTAGGLSTETDVTLSLESDPSSK